MAFLTKNTCEKSNAPHMPGVPSLGLNIDRCVIVFEAWTATRSELFQLLTSPHTITFTLLSIFSPLAICRYKNLGDNIVLAHEMFSSGCHPRLKNAHV